MTMIDDQTEQPDVQDVLIGEMPVIESPSNPLVHLPRGLRRNDGTWDTEAEVRELTGVDEEYLARFTDTNDYYDNLIALGTVRIGQQDLTKLGNADRLAIVGGLLIGEREQIVIAIARITYGNKSTYTMKCQHCQAEFEFDLLLDTDITFKEVKDPQVATQTYMTSNGQTITYRPLTGNDLSEVVKFKGTNAEKNTLLISRVVTLVDGNIVVDPQGFARQLGMADRQKLIAAFNEWQPSANMTLDIPCVVCKEVSPTTFAWWDFFRP